MPRQILRDDQWNRIESLLSGKAGDRGATGNNNRLFIEAILWICRAGIPFLRVITGGLRPVAGKPFLKRYRKIRIWNI